MSKNSRKLWKGNIFVSMLLLMLLIGVFIVTAADPVKLGNLGAKVIDESTYEGCKNKVFGLVGASNEALGARDDLSEILIEKCPGAKVFLQATAGSNPKVQGSLVKAVLQNDNLDYVILDPSANGQLPFTIEEYETAALNLAKIVKDKDKNIKVIMLANTPMKNSGYWNANPTKVQNNIDTFNANLLTKKLGRADLIDYAVDAYSATEDPAGSDECGKYCRYLPDKTKSGYDNIHFGSEGERQVAEALLNTVFGQPTTPVSSGSGALTAPTSAAEKCLDHQRCDEMDKVWLTIAAWVNNLHTGQVFDTVKGWRPYQEVRPTMVITPNIPSGVTNFCIASQGTNEQKALLDTIAWAEAGQYNIMFGNKPFTNYAAHPVETGEMPPKGFPWSGGTSTAAGRYQFLYSTYKDLKGRGYFQTGFNAEEQDKAGLYLLETKRKLSQDELVVAVNSDNLVLVWNKLAAEWASLPSSEKGGKSYYPGQTARGIQDLKNRFQTCLQYHQTGGLSAASSSVASSVSGVVSSVTDIFGGGCPSDMATINNKYCIDKWEATVVDKNTKAEASPHYIPIRTGPITADGLYNQFVNKETTPPGYPMPNRGAEANSNFVAMAVSVSGKTPASFVTREAAKQACENAGKRLCTQSEWYNACAGPGSHSFPQPAYPYGTAYQAGKCNVAIGSSWPPSVIGRTNQGNDMMDPRIGTVKQTNGQLMKQPTGAFPECTNSYGLFDMVGNVHEIVDDITTNGKATYVGAHFARPGQGQTLESQGCQEDTTAHSPTGYTDYSIGFRCCASLS